MKIIRCKNLLWLALFLLSACDADDDIADPSAPSHWEISAEYIANTMMQSNASLAEMVKYGELAVMRDRDLPSGFMAQYRKMAGRMGIRPTPVLYLDTTDSQAIPQAAARFTREGKPYILINPGALRLWSQRQLFAVLGHEMVHLKEWHVTAANLAEAYNRPEISVSHEMEADRVGSGALGSCDPESLKEALEIVHDDDRNDYLNRNPFKSTGDYNDLMSGDHPRLEERRAALDEMITNPPQDCVGRIW